jgi:hypothetical protein
MTVSLDVIKLFSMSQFTLKIPQFSVKVSVSFTSQFVSDVSFLIHIYGRFVT